ncbi:MAG: hypothetical protein KatS3mg131_3558 [Candidatus Tectimicrobiota bacterium]|nr:MAG: hypothetical protein KatS3mg131_3558 [Candidatus Tectomicrobia bacterium]
MAIRVHCPACHAVLADVQPECAHCGAALPPGVLYAVSASLGKVQVAPPPPLVLDETPPHHSPWRPWLAAMLSLVCGLGQLYNGQLGKGLLLLALGAVAVLTFAWPLGKVLAPLVWLYAILDAFLVARRAVPPAAPSRAGYGRGGEATAGRRGWR